MAYSVIDISDCCGECTNAFFYYVITDREQGDSSVTYTITYYVECDDQQSDPVATTFTLSCNEPECIQLEIVSEFCTFEVSFGNTPDCTCDPCPVIDSQCNECNFSGGSLPIRIEFGGTVYTGTMTKNNETSWGFDTGYISTIPACILDDYGPGELQDFRISVGFLCGPFGFSVTSFYIVRDNTNTFIEYGTVPDLFNTIDTIQSDCSPFCWRFTWDSWQQIFPYAVNTDCVITVSVGYC